jgi:hypothetical protein
MRSRVVRAVAALFVAAAAFVPAHLAGASSSKKDVPGFQCPADQATFDYMKLYIQQLIDAGIALPPELADIDDAALCALIGGSGGGGDGGDDTTTTTSTGKSRSVTRRVTRITRTWRSPSMRTG